MTMHLGRPLAALLALLCSLSAFAGSYEDHGYAFLASYTGESAALVDGGKKRGSAYAGQFFVGAEADFGRLIGWQGAKFKLYVASRHGDNLAIDEIGNSVSVQEIWGAQTERLANLTIEQKLFDDRVIIEAGRTVANIHFLGSELCNYFQTNSACGNPTFVFRTSGFTYWPVSSWGGYVKTFLTPQIYVHAGVFEINPLQARDNQHGLNWGIADATGVIAPVALGYRSSPAQARLPAFYEIGGWRDTSRYSDPLRDANGDAALVSGQPYASRSERSGVFARFEQQVPRPDRNSPRGLILFGAALWGTAGQLTQDRFFELGFVQKGTFTGRDRDSLAFVINRQRYSGAALENLRLARDAAGGGDTPANSQYLMELSYGIQVSKLLRVAPNLHYIINPDSFSEPSRTRDLADALVVGLRVDLALTPAIAAITGR
ncbi:carbohydrate porin [Nevskia sp.]|uniref:carbohydrate porin n=1 Tax=Nevskia sp. TaxID=1929292 RepID=UPI002600B354|nr:carbohydrate porin [Nevskia sp.]